MNDEWFFGRNRRGCEGIFPVSYIDIKIPLKESKPVQPVNQVKKMGASASPSSFQLAYVSLKVRALYTFQAETIEDLTIRVSILLNVENLLKEKVRERKR